LKCLQQVSKQTRF